MGYKSLHFLIKLEYSVQKHLRYLIDLMERSKKDGVDGIFYHHIDFHALTKETDFSNVDDYILKSYDNEKVGFNMWEFDENEKNYNLKKKQNGIIRTNCLDCLDRTNVVETKYSYLVLDLMMKEIDSPILENNLNILKR